MKLEGSGVGFGLKPVMCTLALLSSGKEMGKLYGNLMQAALAGFLSPLVGKRQLGALESRPQTTPRACLDQGTVTRPAGTMDILDAWSAPLSFPASAPSNSPLKVDNIPPTAAQCPVLVSFFLFPYQTRLGSALPLANRSTTTDNPEECGHVLPC